jgi:hypothetical protein
LLKYFYILARKLESIVELYHFKNIKMYPKKSFVDVDGLFYVCKMVEIHHKKNKNSSLILFSNFQKNG